MDIHRLKGKSKQRVSVEKYLKRDYSGDRDGGDRVMLK
jgi:hypothetical protein